ncbi:MAG: NUDIX hydrolase [Steroidobacteraceae bacterium]|nr:NUDIX hydrolase [Steroidobacteraceae bacterium]MDW8258921.1 NUDIX hydrolase [Gammaproteobacteria bacterium]
MPRTDGHSYIPAASVLLLRDRAPGAGIEVLMARRPATARSFAGYWVFPGGHVDPADWECGRAALSQAPDTDSAAHDDVAIWASAVAAWRELHEETCGASASALAPQRLRAAVAEMCYWSHWLAPAGAPHPYDTRFFALDAAALEHELRPEPEEIVELRWWAPEHALAAWRTGELALAPPTVMNLADLKLAAGRHAQVATLLANERRREIVPIQPRAVQSGTVVHVLMPWDRDYRAGDLTAAAAPLPARYRELPSRLTLPALLTAPR